MSNGITTLKTISIDGTKLLDVGTAETSGNESNKYASFSLGGYYAASSEAPATNTYNGIIGMLLIIGRSVSDSEMKDIAKIIWDFDEACGRHINF